MREEEGWARREGRGGKQVDEQRGDEKGEGGERRGRERKVKEKKKSNEGRERSKTDNSFEPSEARHYYQL